ENITIEEFEKSHLARIQTAKQAYWENGSWRLEDGTVYTMNEAEGIKSTAKFKEQIIPLDVTPREISWEQKEPEEMTIRELREYISVLERQHQPTARQWCEIYMRISIPLASFFFAMIGAPLGTQKQRTSSSIGLGISIIVIFIYYAIMTLTTGLGKGGVMNPLLACIIPNLICLGAGVFLLQKKNA
ncbi:LptF/LptG family permease, partial [Phascolarctobacterium faecium]